MPAGEGRPRGRAGGAGRSRDPQPRRTPPRTGHRPAPGRARGRGAAGQGRHNTPLRQLPAPPRTAQSAAYLHLWVHYHRLLHNCILTLLNGSAELFKHLSLPPANNSLDKKKKKKKRKRAAKELRVALAPFLLKRFLGHKWLISKRFGSDLVLVKAGKQRGSAAAHVTARMGGCHLLQGLVGEYVDVHISLFLSSLG